LIVNRILLSATDFVKPFADRRNSDLSDCAFVDSKKRQMDFIVRGICHNEKSVALMPLEVDIKEIKELLGELNRKLDALVEEQEVRGIMAVSERSLKDLLKKEPNLYTSADLKAVYE
jgi:hypothetical protein